MKRLLPLIPLLAVAALALAACGSGGSGPHVAGLTTNAHADPAQHSAAYNSLLSAVKCLRQHGVAGVPNPVVGANGNVSVPGLDPSKIPPAAATPCAKQIAAAETGSDAPASSSDLAALVRVAHCMRRNGYPNWPDPNSKGEFLVSSRDAGTPAQMQQATNACNSYMPKSGWHLIVNPSIPSRGGP
jgi:hypothetical protein